jgi:hypothetical protein
MQTLKLSCLWIPFFSDTVIYHLIRQLSKKKIEITSPSKADLLILGPYNLHTYTRKIFNSIKKRINLEKYFKNIDILSLRSYQPLKIFYCTENFSLDSYKANYYISSNLGVHEYENKHLRFPLWKDNIDWSHAGVKRDVNTGNARRFGSFYKIEDLMMPQGEDFLKKKNICIFSSHLNQPRKSFYLNFSKNFRVDGYGLYFDKSIKDHNSSKYKKKDIMKNYSFNLCPENFMYPGFYTEKIPDSFIGKCLPISWADNNINNEFNQKAFINLNDHLNSDMKELFQSLRDEKFLKSYTKEPLLLKKPSLEIEKKFIEKILFNLQ